MIGSILLCDRCGETGGALAAPSGTQARLKANRGTIQHLQVGRMAYVAGRVGRPYSIDLCARCIKAGGLEVERQRQVSYAARYGYTFTIGPEPHLCHPTWHRRAPDWDLHGGQHDLSVRPRPRIPQAWEWAQASPVLGTRGSRLPSQQAKRRHLQVPRLAPQGGQVNIFAVIAAVLVLAAIRQVWLETHR